MIGRICVYCGSRAGARPAYAEAGAALGRALAARGTGLVYGGGDVGLMGVVADAVLAGGGEVTGVIPHALVAREVAHGGLSDLREVDSMHERKALMVELADAFIALPGGLGTLDELFEALTWAQLGVHAKPCGALDVDGYFGPLLALLDHAVEEGFIDPVHRSLLVVESEVEPLLARLDGWSPPHVVKWIDRSAT